MFEFRSPIWRRRMAVMICGIVFIGLGICLFKLSLMGNDPHSAMVLSITNHVTFPFSTILIICNLLWFALEFSLGRKLIGIGTFFNWFFVGFFVDLWNAVITGLFPIPEGIFGRLIIMLLGVLILSLAAALYQTADLGIAPYDAASIIMAERLPVPYFWCRIITDSACAAVAFFLGGIVGLGTLVCALGLGPFISFFSRTVAEKVVCKKA